MIAVRLAKIMLVAGIALHMGLIVLGNIVDYDSNWAFVQHVLTMDTTFQSPALMTRAITDPDQQRLAYHAIIAAEAVGAVFLLWGALRLLFAVGGDDDTFHRAKTWAIFGLAWSCAIWIVGFVAIGAEWFAMWQSETWNGQATAVQFALVDGVVLVFTALRE